MLPTQPLIPELPRFGAEVSGAELIDAMRVVTASSQVTVSQAASALYQLASVEAISSGPFGYRMNATYRRPEPAYQPLPGREPLPSESKGSEA